MIQLKDRAEDLRGFGTFIVCKDCNCEAFGRNEYHFSARSLLAAIVRDVLLTIDHQDTKSHAISRGLPIGKIGNPVAVQSVARNFPFHDFSFH